MCVNWDIRDNQYPAGAVPVLDTSAFTSGSRPEYFVNSNRFCPERKTFIAEINVFFTLKS